MTFFQKQASRIRCSVRCKVESKLGKVFLCHSFGKGMYKDEYQDIYGFIQLNPVGEPIEFYLNDEDFIRAVQLGKLKQMW